MKRILVTGAAGFLGSHLVDHLLANPDNRVVTVDDGRSAAQEIESLVRGWQETGRFELHPVAVATYVRRAAHAVDEVYHLASPVGPLGVLRFAGKIADAILQDTLAIAGLAHYHHAKLLFVSTSEIYGGGVEGFCSENMVSHIGPPRASARLEYALGKLAAEVALANWAASMHLDVKIVRPFNIAGARQLPRGGFVLPRFVLQALLGVPLTVYGTGHQVRAFTGVEDIVRGLVAAMDRGGRGEIYNLGNEENRSTIYDLACEILTRANVVGRIDLVDPKILHGAQFEEAADKFPDVTKSETMLGWRAEIARGEVIDRVIGYWRSQGEVGIERWRASVS